MSEQFDSIYWRGQGPLFLAARDATGQPLGFSFVGDVESVEGSPSVSRQDIKENVTGQRNTAASFITEQSTDITINFKSAKPTHLAQALQADLTVKSAGNVSAESHTAYHDKLIKLANVKVSNVAISGSAEGTDFITHADEGMVEILSTGNIGDGAAITIGYDFAAQKHLSANPSNTEFMMTFPGINTANNDKRGRCTVYRITIDPAFLCLIQGDQEMSLSVKAKMLMDDLRPVGDQLYGWEFED